MTNRFALTGAAGTGAAGDLTVSFAATATLTGASGTMAVQGIEARNSSSTPVEGVAATGAAAEPTSITGAGEVTYLDGVATSGASGTIDGQLGIPGGVYFLGARSPARIGTMTTAVSYRPRIQITAVSPQRRVIVCYFDDRRTAA